LVLISLAQAEQFGLPSPEFFAVPESVLFSAGDAFMFFLNLVNPAAQCRFTNAE
jgi:hypothetical protein